MPKYTFRGYDNPKPDAKENEPLWFQNGVFTVDKVYYSEYPPDEPASHCTYGDLYLKDDEGDHVFESFCFFDEVE